MIPVFEKHSIEFHGRRRPNKADISRSLFGSSESTSDRCKNAFKWSPLVLVLIVGLVVLPVISACFPSISHAFVCWIPAIIISILSLILGCIGHRYSFDGNYQFFPIILGLITFYMLGLLKLRQIVSWNWYVICIPLYFVGVYLLFLTLFWTCCCPILMGSLFKETGESKSSTTEEKKRLV